MAESDIRRIMLRSMGFEQEWILGSVLSSNVNDSGRQFGLDVVRTNSVVMFALRDPLSNFMNALLGSRVVRNKIGRSSMIVGNVPIC
jgi:hypothetical protein